MFRKSSFSNGSGGSNCVEVDLDFRSASGCGTSTCVEVAGLKDDGEVLVRDSKDPSGPVLSFTPAEWQAFIAGVKAGEFDIAS